MQMNALQMLPVSCHLDRSLSRSRRSRRGNVPFSDAVCGAAVTQSPERRRSVALVVCDLVRDAMATWPFGCQGTQRPLGCRATQQQLASTPFDLRSAVVFAATMVPSWSLAKVAGRDTAAAWQPLQ